jgi:3-dehydroquinate synthase
MALFPSHLQPPTLKTVVFCRDPFDRLARLIRGRHGGAAVVSDRNVMGLYGGGLASALRRAGLPHLLLTFEPGDAHKTRRTKELIEDAMVRGGTGRDWAVVALGGGVTGDLAGFVAGTFMRGVEWFYLPTSLLAMVDASIGGKTSVNTSDGKNLVGLFHRPRAVLICTDFLRTLPGVGWRDATAEIIKHAAACDRRYFALLEKVLPLGPGTGRDALRRVIRRSVEIKAAVVDRDEREGGPRSILNFGHTVGHAVEAASGCRIAHGRAVAIGMVAEARISVRAGLLPAGECRRIEELVRSAGFTLPRRGPSPRAILRSMQVDKKRSGGAVRFVLLRSIGKPAVSRAAFTRSVPPAIVTDVVRGLTGTGR